MAIHRLPDGNNNTVMEDSVYLYFFELPSDLEGIRFWLDATELKTLDDKMESLTITIFLDSALTTYHELLSMYIETARLPRSDAEHVFLYGAHTRLNHVIHEHNISCKLNRH